MRRVDAGPRHLLGHGLDADNLVGRPPRDRRHRRHVGNRFAPVAGVDDQPFQTAGAEQAPVDLGGADLAAAFDVVPALREGVEVEQGRTLAADHEAERLVELRGSDGRRPVALAHQRLERLQIEVSRHHAVTVMVDQGQIARHACGRGGGSHFSRHRGTSGRVPPRSWLSHSRPRDA